MGEKCGNRYTETHPQSLCDGQQTSVVCVSFSVDQPGIQRRQAAIRSEPAIPIHSDEG